MLMLFLPEILSLAFIACAVGAVAWALWPMRRARARDPVDAGYPPIPRPLPPSPAPPPRPTVCQPSLTVGETVFVFRDETEKAKAAALAEAALREVLQRRRERAT